MMANIEIYSSDYCSYCMRAKSLLKQRSLAFTEYNIQHDDARKTEMLDRASGARTIPQIFINDRHVGGWDELYALDRKGELDAWLIKKSP
ncbi:MAG: glutaredoxin 3 [Mariprofundaceae bacterium]